MKYSGVLAKKERETIFELFLNKHKLKFSEIEKSLKIRSNMVSYHLTQMINQGLIKKDKDSYLLTSNAEKYIPVFENITGKELSATPALLVAVIYGKKVLLMKRDKRPYKCYWGVLGGKLRHHESIAEGSIRLAENKAGVQVKFLTFNGVIHERVVEDNLVKHSFLSVFTKVKALSKEIKENCKWVDISKIDKKEIIPSDYWLLKKKLNSKNAITNMLMHEKSGELKKLEIK